MSLLIAKEVWCDKCSESVRLDDGMMWLEWPGLRKEGWTRRKGKHFCPKCSKIGEATDGK